MLLTSDQYRRELVKRRKGQGAMRRRAIILMATMVAAVLLASGVAIAEDVSCDLTPPCYGTPEGDRIESSEEETGAAVSETVYASGGNDNIAPLGDDDTVYGGSGNDRIEVSGGSDTAYGQSGNDTIHLDFGDSPGSTDYGYGGGGADIITAQDGNVDKIDCGKGTDTVYYDEGIDTIKGCEKRNP